MIVYVHGLNSNSQGNKLELLKTFFKHKIVIGVDYDSRNLKDYGFVLGDLKRQIEQYNPDTPLLLIGTSLGAYWANQLSNHYKCKKVLLNPCLFPSKMLKSKIGKEQTIYETGEIYIFTKEMVESLGQKEHEMDLDKTLCLLEMGDEIIDNQQNQNIFPNTICFPNGNHRFSRFKEVLPLMADFYDHEC